MKPLLSREYPAVSGGLILSEEAIQQGPTFEYKNIFDGTNVYKIFGDYRKYPEDKELTPISRTILTSTNTNLGIGVAINLGILLGCFFSGMYAGHYFKNRSL